MRISWLSNVAWVNVGYGKIVKNLLPKINKIHSSSLIANYGLMGTERIKDFFDGITYYGPGEGGFEVGLVPNHIKDFKSDVFISIFDTWAMPNLGEECAKAGIKWVPFCPIDSDDVNPYYIESLKYAFKIIPMSIHAEKCLKKYYPDKTLPNIPLGVDPEIFKPLWNTKEEKNKLKTKLGFSPDTFLITALGDIKSFRKRWPETIQAIKLFRERNPHIKVGFYIHTNIRRKNGQDFDISALIQKEGIGDIVRVVDTYSYLKGISDNEVAENYNASDVFIQISAGEGFGAGFIESAACGTPSIMTDSTSGKQVVKHCKSGYLVKCKNYYDQSGAKKAMPDVENVVDCLELIYHKGSHNYKKDCIEFVKDLTWDKIVDNYWIPTLEKLEKDLEINSIKIPEPSEELKERAKKISIY